MIYTVTLNPSVDYIVRLDSFTPGGVNRSSYEAVVPGGKGINVSVMLRQLDVPSTALGFLAGFTGRELRRLVRSLGCRESFIMLPDGFSRINVKMKAGEETEINGAGPRISEEALARLLDMIDNLQADDILVLSGSVPSSVPQTIYRDIAARLVNKQVSIVADASGKLLTDLLPYRPFLIKPNHHELGDLFGAAIEHTEDAVFYAKKLQEMGARHVLVSLAGEGAVLLTEDGDVYTAKAPKGEVVNSVGAGDSMVAGFLAAYLESRNFEKALSLGIAAGSASAFSEGIAERNSVFDLLATVQPV